MRDPSTLSVVAVALIGLVNLGRGGIHLLAPDGGLDMIAGLDVGTSAAVALSLIGAVGAGQITMALVDFAAAWRFRSFVRPLLLIHTVQAALAVVLLFAWRPLPHAVPGQWGALAALIVIGFIAALEFSRTRDATS
jgi:hypothetical protein